MATREIPRSQWRTFFDTFSQQHEGWLTTVEVIGPDVPGDQLEADDLPFQGISADPKGSEPDSVAITLGNDPSDEVTRIVDDATRVLFEQSEASSQESLEIEASGGEKTIIRLRAAERRELTGGGAA